MIKKEKVNVTCGECKDKFDIIIPEGLERIRCPRCKKGMIEFNKKNREAK